MGQPFFLQQHNTRQPCYVVSHPAGKMRGLFPLPWLALPPADCYLIVKDVPFPPLCLTLDRFKDLNDAEDATHMICAE